MSALTVLTADPILPAGAFDLPRKPRMVKAFRLGAEGQVEVTPYDNAVTFTAHRIEVTDIRSLASAITTLSQRTDSVLIRGEPKFGYDGIGRRRTLDNFQPVPGGTSWVMLDVDNVPIPDGVDPLSAEAREWVIAQLPPEFHDVSYFYQYSASAGILKADGTPLKKGISIHLFFWLGGHLLEDREFSACWELHCLRKGFFWRRVSNGVPRITYGIDLSVVRNCVQPHYIAPPLIGEGVQCLLAPDQRQGLVLKGQDVVVLPKPEDSLLAKAKHLRRKVDREWKREQGWVSETQVTRTSNGAHRVQNFLHAPVAHTGRVFLGATPYGDDSVILSLEDEKSKGSWYVSKFSPTFAQRFGDGAQVPLREFSEGAYQHVRTVLKWFDEVEEHRLELTQDGFVPPLSTFVRSHSASLVHAPTGSGKTRAIIDYVKQDPQRLFIYCAPTIPLCRQTESDLQQAGVPVVFYQDVTYPHDLRPGVLVTTNKSLPKFIAMASDQVWTHRCTLLVDEVHLGLDEFQRSIQSAKSFAEALEMMDACLFFTGTITDTQIAMLGQIVARARRHIHDELVIHRFASVKSNPLWVLDVADFDADVMALFEELGAARREGKPLPRVVIAVDASKLDFYRQLLAQHSLTECSHVISRKESTEEEVMAAAGDVERPILVCSPIFGVGLNFARQPDLYWLSYNYLQVDENHIVQSLNRANRNPGQPPAEVRLYVHEKRDEEFEVTNQVKLRGEVAELLGQEASVKAVMDGHLMLDRVTYNEVRNAEQKTGAAIAKLEETAGFQNFQQVDPPDLSGVDVDELTSQAKLLRKVVRENYEADVLRHAKRCADDGWSFTIGLMDQAFAARQDLRYGGTMTTQLDLDNRTQAGVLRLCGPLTVPQAAEVHVPRLRRLMALQVPFVSANFSPERNDGEYRQVAAEKVRALCALLPKLQALRMRSIDGVRFGSWMATQGGQEAVRAIANNEADYMALARTLDRMRKGTEAKRLSAGKAAREKVNRDLFIHAREFLSTLGVVFEKKDPSQKTSPFDPTKPVVPNWDFEAMEVALERLAQSLDSMRRLPGRSEALRYAEDPGVEAVLCEVCMHQDPHGECRMLHPTAHHLDPLGPSLSECADRRPVSNALLAKVQALNAQVSDEQDVRPNRYVPHSVQHELLWGRSP